MFIIKQEPILTSNGNSITKKTESIYSIYKFDSIFDKTKDN